jgi:hypothetical protein
MQVDRQLVDAGLNSAAERAIRELGRNVGIASDDIRDFLIYVLEDWPRDLSRRFVRDFAEQVGIADISRRHFGHRGLGPADIQDHLKSCEAFLNSWTHP